jgi:DNA mismatch repair ATPase MutS
VLAHLIESPHFFIVATHERRLTELADGRAATNYHFREVLEHEGLVFDYTLRPGPSQTRTALRVLEREGYPPELLRRARQWLSDVNG